MKIVTGGQTGVDIAALDAAIKLGYPYGGWVPKGRFNEDGPISARYRELKEAGSTRTTERTILNVRASDALLVLTDGSHSNGTQAAVHEAENLKLPIKIVTLSNVDDKHASKRIADFLREHKPEILNIAGPRESEAPGIGAMALSVLEAALVSS